MADISWSLRDDVTVTAWAPIEPPVLEDYRGIDSHISPVTKERLREVMNPRFSEQDIVYIFQNVQDKVSMGATLRVVSDILGVNMFEPRMLREILYHLHIHGEQIGAFRRSYTGYYEEPRPFMDWR